VTPTKYTKNPTNDYETIKKGYQIVVGIGASEVLDDDVNEQTKFKIDEKKLQDLKEIEGCHAI